VQFYIERRAQIDSDVKPGALLFKHPIMADKFKKIDKEYVLSDSSVNCYGFRLATAGYQLANYQKNPIGFYMHDRNSGVVLRWEDLRVDGDTVYGKPVINLSNPKGQQLVDEIENGFLNAASMGEFVVLDYSMEPDMMLPNQTGPTITNWYNRECSLVDIPGNSNALCKLFDKEGNEVTLKSLMAGNTEALTNDKLNFGNMKQVTLTLNAAFYASVGLAATATPAEIEAKLPLLMARADKATQLEIDNLTLTTERDGYKTKLDSLKATAVKKEVEDLLELAHDQKKITTEVRAQLAKDYAENPAGLKALVDGMGVYSSVVNQLKPDTKLMAKFEGKTWDELHQADLLPELKATNLELFKQMYKSEHGVEYKG
jgi:hypothetical protein